MKKLGPSGAELFSFPCLVKSIRITGWAAHSLVEVCRLISVFNPVGVENQSSAIVNKFPTNFRDAYPGSPTPLLSAGVAVILVSAWSSRNCAIPPSRFLDEVFDVISPLPHSSHRGVRSDGDRTGHRLRWHGVVPGQESEERRTDRRSRVTQSSASPEKRAATCQSTAAGIREGRTDRICRQHQCGADEPLRPLRDDAAPAAQGQGPRRSQLRLPRR